MIFFTLFLMLKSFGMGCDPLPSGSCTQPNGVDTCRIENGNYCSVSSGAACSKVINNSGGAIFMGAKAGTNNWAAFHQNIPQGITTSSCSCTGGLKIWNVGAAECSANLPDVNDGDSVTINDAAPPLMGSATFACNGTTLSAPTGVTCNSLPPTQCAETNLQWTAGGNLCEYLVPLSDDGTTIIASDAAGTTGTAEFTCNGTTWSMPASPVCNPAPAIGCTLATPVSWTTQNIKGNNKTCEILGAPIAFNEGEQKTLSGGQPVAHGSYPTTGSITYKCEGGALSIISQDCTAHCTFKCQGPLRHKWLGAGNPKPECWCIGSPFETVLSGGSPVTRDGEGIGPPAHGQITVSCDDGEFTYVSECHDGPPD